MKDEAEPLMAVVTAPDGVRFVAIADCAGQLTSRITEYVLGRCDDALWPAIARRVRGLIENDRLQGAILLYFEHVGDRWDHERLELAGAESSLDTMNLKVRNINALV